jgi:hypothetical protein
MAESAMLSGFDFNEDMGISISADNINFACFLPIVSDFDAVPYGPEVSDRDFFPPLTEAYPFSGQTL